MKLQKIILGSTCILPLGGLCSIPLTSCSEQHATFHYDFDDIGETNDFLPEKALEPCEMTHEEAFKKLLEDIKKDNKIFTDELVYAIIQNQIPYQNFWGREFIKSTGTFDVVVNHVDVDNQTISFNFSFNLYCKESQHRYEMNAKVKNIKMYCLYRDEGPDDSNIWTILNAPQYLDYLGIVSTLSDYFLIENRNDFAIDCTMSPNVALGVVLRLGYQQWYQNLGYFVDYGVHIDTKNFNDLEYVDAARHWLMFFMSLGASNINGIKYLSNVKCLDPILE